MTLDPGTSWWVIGITVAMVTSLVALVLGIFRGLGGIASVVVVTSVVEVTVVSLPATVVSVDVGVESVGTTLCNVGTKATGCLTLILCSM